MFNTVLLFLQLFALIRASTPLFQDIVENEDIKLDKMFIASLVNDLIKVNIVVFLLTF